MLDEWPGVSARGVLDGEADALAGLCDRRGPSVVGYCECVCGPERAIEAASAAFAAFRAVAVRSSDPLSIDAEALLLGRTRAAAAQRAPKPAGNLVYADVPCSQVATLLAENATGSLSAADRDRLRRHLARCVSCRATQGVQHQAERAYFHPSIAAVDPISRQEIIEALRRAVPMPTPNGNRLVTDLPVPAVSPAVVPPIVQQASVASTPPRIPAPLPRKVPVAGSALSSTPVGKSPPNRPPVTPPPPATGAPPSVAPVSPGGVAAPVAGAPPAIAVEPSAATPVVGGSPNGGPALPGGTTPPGEPPPTGGAHPTGGAPPITGAPPSGVGSPPASAPPTPFEDLDTPPNGMPAAEWDSPTGVMSAVEINEALGYEQSGHRDPASHAGWAEPDASTGGGEPPAEQPRRRGRRPAPLEGGAHRRSSARIFGPAAVLAVGLLIALFVAGVFNGGGSPRSSANPLSGAQNDPSETVPSTVTGAGGSSTLNGSGTQGGSATNGNAAVPTSASLAAGRRAAKKRAEELARRVQNGSTTTKTKSTPGSGGSATTPTSVKPTATTPSSTETPLSAPTTTKKPSSGSTVHELGTGETSAPPVTDVPATGVTGYQPS